MDKEQKKEYQTVILAALLHDIGKIVQRVTGPDKFKGKHEDLGADFVNGTGMFSNDGTHSELNAFSQMIRDDWVCKEKLEQCIRKHHSGYKHCGWIVHKSDSYSTKERFTEDDGVTTYPPKGSLVSLKSVFSSINLGKNEKTPEFGYNATQLNSFKSFPVEGKGKLGNDETLLLFDQFIKEELLNIDLKGSSFDKFFNTLHSILEKYLWCMPCHTHPAIADVSIFDHLKSSSAIAACLYQYHLYNNTLEPKYIKKDNEKKFLLVGGDLSGIQKYIYQISNIAGEGGVAKRLRSRSFFISVLLEVIITKVLQELNLPICCNMVSDGGKFILLAPNTTEIKTELEKLYKEISNWILNEFSGEICLVMDWSTVIKGGDFYRRKDNASNDTISDETGEIPVDESDPDKPRECNFRDRVAELYCALENGKLTKFKNVLLDNNIWHEEKFKRKEKYESYGDEIRDCHACKKFPAEFQDPHSRDASEKLFCKLCAEDKVIGRKLLDTQYVAIGKDIDGSRIKSTNSTRLRDRDTIFFFDDGYFIKTLDSYEWKTDFIILQRLRDHEDDEESVKLGTTHRFLANYAPFFENYSEDEVLCKLCKENRPCEQIESMKKSDSKKDLYTFSCIAAASAQATDDPVYYKGNQLIGVLKADVDNLGLIFSEGFGNNLTISRYLTMSRMLELFFSGWMYRVLKDNLDYQEIYTVYSGGDDLVLVGPWEKIINFAIRLNKEFRKFTCHNDDITLSAGIAAVQPKYPISAAIQLADKYLEISKTAPGKNSLTIFDTTIKWSDLNAIVTTKNILNKGHVNYSDTLTTQFIYRLLTYHHMYLKANEGVIRNLIFHSRMNYDVRRNLMERIYKEKDVQKKNWFIENIIQLIQKLYQAPVDKLIMKNLKIIIYWILYKNRKYKKEGGGL